MNRISELRQKNGLKQADLAKHLGVAQNTLSNWERGINDIDTDNLMKIADYFSCTTDYVLGRGPDELDGVRFAFDSLSEKEDTLDGLSDDQLDDVRKFVRFLKQKDKL